MTNVKKLGLTALAGSLVATSGFAGALDVTGTAKVTYASLDESEVTGNPYSMSQGMGFSGSGDIDDIGTIKDPVIKSFVYKIRGDLDLRVGNIDDALLSYQQAKSSSKNTILQFCFPFIQTRIFTLI